MPGGVVAPRVHRAAMRAAALGLARRVEALVGGRQVGDDVVQLHLDAPDQAAAGGAMPLEGVGQARRALAFDHQAAAVGLGPLRRMQQVRRHQEDVAFAQVHALVAAAVPHQQVGIALELPEELLQRVVVEVAACIRPADHGDHEIGIGPDLPVADRRLQQMAVLVEPALEAEGVAVAEVGHRRAQDRAQGL
jgi:hypothetical protein